MIKKLFNATYFADYFLHYEGDIIKVKPSNTLRVGGGGGRHHYSRIQQVSVGIVGSPRASTTLFSSTTTNSSEIK